MPVWKKSAACDYTFHQLLIIVEALWSHPVLQISKQVVVTQNKIRAVRRVVKQLPVEMLQKCSSMSSGMQTCIVTEEHYTGWQFWCLFFWIVRKQVFFFFLSFTLQTWLFDTGIQNLLPDKISASILAMTTLRGSLMMYGFFVYNKFFFLIAHFVNSSPEVTFWIDLVYIN
jgi:hypothetical protein